jgi:hypothetical protein
MKIATPPWISKGMAALLGSVDGALSAGTLGEFYDQLYGLFYSDRKIGYPVQANDPVEAAIWQIHELGRRARDKDEEALARLVMISAAASLQLQGVGTRLPDHLRKFTERCHAWLGPVSRVPTINCAMEEALENVALEAKQRRTKSDLRAKPTGFAFMLLTYMTLIRFGFLENRNTSWQSRCCALRPLGRKTVRDWWTLGREELERSFPALPAILSSHGAVDVQLPKDRALQRVEQAFVKMWKWFAYLSIFSLATNLVARFKSHRK